MKINALLILLLTFLSFEAFNQITITSDDMPGPGDTVRLSIASNIISFDYTLSGPDYIWDYSELEFLTQQVDTFVNSLETPVIYQIVFIPVLVSNMAQKMPSFDFIPNFEVEDAYRYFKKSDEAFNDVGFAFSLNQIPFPVKYDDPDIIYKFPLDYEDTYASFASFQMEVPSLGYMASSRSRSNIVDGWGTIITPYGEFQALRVYSEIDAYDSIYIDSLNLGFPLERTIREYKWLAQGFNAPVLRVTEDGLIVTASYPDSLRTPYAVPGNELSRDDVLIYPNPARDHLFISLTINEESPVVMRIAGTDGRSPQVIWKGLVNKGSREFRFDIPGFGLPPGTYIINIKIGEDHIWRKLVIL